MTDLRERAAHVRDAVEEWCEGRAWLLRAPRAAWMAWAGVRHLADTDYASLFGALNLGIHEAGHLLSSWLGSDFLTTAGGTLLQCAAPLAAAVMFARQPDYFATAFFGSWLATNLYSIATYIADAGELDLPLVSAGGGDSEVGHDWNYMLAELGLLSYDTTLAALVRVAAFLLMWGSIAVQSLMLWRMAHARC